MDFEHPQDNDFAKAERHGISPEVIEKIEQFDKASLIDIDKAYILLVLADEKPAAALGLHQKRNEDGEAFKKKVEALRTLLRDAGLYVAEQEKEFEGSSIYNYVISKDPLAAEKLIQMYGMDKDPAKTEQFGLMMGYPPTAVAAVVESFKNEGGFDTSIEPELPEEIQFQEYMAFKNIILSKDHWQEELATVKRWAAAVKEISPNLYHEMTSVREMIKNMREENPEDLENRLHDDQFRRFIKFRDPDLYKELTVGEK